jgi:hypothetical protein
VFDVPLGGKPLPISEREKENRGKALPPEELLAQGLRQIFPAFRNAGFDRFLNRDLF